MAWQQMRMRWVGGSSVDVDVMSEDIHGLASARGVACLFCMLVYSYLFVI